MSNVVELNCVTTNDIPVRKVLDNAPENLDYVVVLAIDDKGEYYFASSSSNKESALFLVEKFKKFLLED